MKTLLAGLILLGATIASATPPDPRDSIIIESKTVDAQSGVCQSAILKVRVYITNKDSLSVVSLVLDTKTTSGDAYAILSRPVSCGPRTQPAVTTFLYPPGPNFGNPRLPTRVANFNNYHSSSPDTFKLTFVFDPTDDDSKLPPNLTRAPFIDLKFDSVSGIGQFQIDSCKVLSGTIGIVTISGYTVPINFVKGIISVTGKGDLNKDAALTSADVVLILNCIFLNIPPPAGTAACEMNCNGVTNLIDATILLNAVFLGEPFPC